MPLAARRVRKAGVTMVIVEHVMQVIRNVSDRVYVLHHGEAIAERAPGACPHVDTVSRH